MKAAARVIENERLRRKRHRAAFIERGEAEPTVVHKTVLDKAVLAEVVGEAVLNKMIVESKPAAVEVDRLVEDEKSVP